MIYNLLQLLKKVLNFLGGIMNIQTKKTISKKSSFWGYRGNASTTFYKLIKKERKKEDRAISKQLIRKAVENEI